MLACDDNEFATLRAVAGDQVDQIVRTNFGGLAKTGQSGMKAVLTRPIEVADG
jgi:hypothetical protein